MKNLARLQKEAVNLTQPSIFAASKSDVKVFDLSKATDQVKKSMGVEMVQALKTIGVFKISNYGVTRQML